MDGQADAEQPQPTCGGRRGIGSSPMIGKKNTIAEGEKRSSHQQAHTWRRMAPGGGVNCSPYSDSR